MSTPWQKKMAGSSKRLLAGLFLLSLIILNVFAEANIDLSSSHEEGAAALYKRPSHPRITRINCRFACSRRCRKTSRKNVCMRACGTCCFRCHCVPPGTYGNRHMCPCYASLKTHDHKLKCP